jgi:hypothetical protein
MEPFSVFMMQTESKWYETVTQGPVGGVEFHPGVSVGPSLIIKLEEGCLVVDGSTNQWNPSEEDQKTSSRVCLRFSSSC